MFELRSVSIGEIKMDPAIVNIGMMTANIVGPSLDRLKLSPFATELAINSSPLIVWKAKPKQYMACGGLRSMYFLQQMDDQIKVPTIVVPRDAIGDPEIFAAQTTLIDLLCHQVDHQAFTNVVGMLWEELGKKENREKLSRRFVSKFGIAEAAGINRRDFPKSQGPFRSEFLAYSGRMGGLA